VVWPRLAIDVQSYAVWPDLPAVTLATLIGGKPLSSKAFGQWKSMVIPENALVAKLQFNKARKEAATFHAFDPLLFKLSTRPMPYADGLRCVTSWRAGYSEYGA
jgi:hypothetical protein